MVGLNGIVVIKPTKCLKIARHSVLCIAVTVFPPIVAMATINLRLREWEDTIRGAGGQALNKGVFINFNSVSMW